MSDHPWPLRVIRRIDLKLQRGNVFRMFQKSVTRYYMVIGWNGYEETYICWEAPERRIFEIQYTIAHDCARMTEEECRLSVLASSFAEMLAALPPIDHVGLPAIPGVRQLKRPKEAPRIPAEELDVHKLPVEAMFKRVQESLWAPAEVVSLHSLPPVLNPHDAWISISITRPPDWSDIFSVIARVPIAFDERGTKETMSVKKNHWKTFLQRQRQRLKAELDCLLPHDERVEIQQLIDRMDDWRNLDSYSSQRVSMAPTERGQEMRLHVVAFREKTNGSVDYMRIYYQKRLEVQRPQRYQSSPPVRLAQSILTGGLWSLMESCQERKAESDERKALELLRQPDIAKYTLGLMFRSALAKDGILLEIT